MDLKFRTLFADEIDVRIGSVNRGGVNLLLYKDARCDMSILDEHVGSLNWKREHEVIDGKLFCSVSIYDPEKKEWISTLDDRTRESHLQMDGVIADIDSTFEVENLTDGGIDNMLYPLDPNGSAGNVCNCRCTVAPVVF